jgi:NAD(P)H-dependent FMN reductase
MYTIISSTNRKGSHTERVAREYQRLLSLKGIHAEIFSLQNIDPVNRNEEFKKIEIDILIPTTKFIFILPEYNGSYPGVLKTMIDYSDIRKTWHFKKALLTGVATGRAGNLRGMDHLADTLHYLKMNIHYNKLPISLIDKVMNADGRFNKETASVVNAQLDEYIKF